jgi:hypothetical protein
MLTIYWDNRYKWWSDNNKDRIWLLLDLTIVATLNKQSLVHDRSITEVKKIAFISGCV